MTLTGSQRLGVVLFGLFVLVALAGPALTPYSPLGIDGESLLPPSKAHPLGTNTIGQDIWSQLVHSARTTLVIGLAVSVISTLLSALLGLAAGYSRRLDPLLDGLANMLLVLPSLLLVLIVASFTGGGTGQLIMTLGLLTWPGYMKLIRASVLSLKEREFVKAAQLYRGGAWYILTRHLLPFIGPLVRTKFILSFRSAVAMEAGLSFLGIGHPNTVTWGKMLQDAFSRTQTFMTDAWQWMILPPAVSILLVTVALALMGESRPRANPFAASLRRRPSRIAETAPQPAPAAAIAVRDVAVRYRDKTILHPLSFEVKPGAITALVGESGSGKTTLARTIYGLVPAESVSGQVFVNGQPIYRAEGAGAMQRWVDAAYIFQDPRTSFNPIMTIGAQFYEAMRRPLSAEARRLAAAAALREVQLPEHLLERYPHELSGGMLSRALIALALVNEPKILIADEPTGALDPIVKREIFDLLAGKVREHRMTLLLITHDIPAARHIADEIWTLREGKLLAGERKRSEWSRNRSLPPERDPVQIAGGE